MRKTIYACLALTCLLAVSIAGTANANRLQFRPGAEVTLTSLGKITFHTSFSDYVCKMTLRGRLLGEAVENTSGSRIGEIDAFQASECESPPITEPLSLPWPMRLTASYTGTRVEFTISGFSFLIPEQFGGLECLYSGNANASAAVSSGVTGLVTSAANPIRNVGNVFCTSEGNLRGTFSLEPHQTISTI